MTITRRELLTRGAKKRRWGMAIDLDRCTLCGSCTVACRQENNIPTAPADDEHKGALIEWISILWREPEEEGAFPEGMPFPCQHCANAPCVKVCPVGATFKSPEGITMQIWERCIGCRYCMVACPYGRRSFNWDEPRFDGTLAQMLNPDVATRPEGVVEKCTFCHHRIRDVKEQARAEGREPRDDELQRLREAARLLGLLPQHRHPLDVGAAVLLVGRHRRDVVLLAAGDRARAARAAAIEIDHHAPAALARAAREEVAAAEVAGHEISSAAMRTRVVHTAPAPLSAAGPGATRSSTLAPQPRAHRPNAVWPAPIGTAR